MSLLYRWLTRLLRRVAPMLAAEGTKLHEGLVGRADAHRVLARWAEAKRDPDAADPAAVERPRRPLQGPRRAARERLERRRAQRGASN